MENGKVAPLERESAGMKSDGHIDRLKTQYVTNTVECVTLDRLINITRLNKTWEAHLHDDL